MSACTSVLEGAEVASAAGSCECAPSARHLGHEAADWCVCGYATHTHDCAPLTVGKPKQVAHTTDAASCSASKAEAGATSKFFVWPELAVVVRASSARRVAKFGNCSSELLAWLVAERGAAWFCTPSRRQTKEGRCTENRVSLTVAPKPSQRTPVTTNMRSPTMCATCDEIAGNCAHTP